MGMGVAGIISHNYYGSFPHSLRLAPVRFNLTRSVQHQLFWGLGLIHHMIYFLGKKPGRFHETPLKKTLSGFDHRLGQVSLATAADACSPGAWTLALNLLEEAQKMGKPPFSKDFLGRFFFGGFLK